MGRQWQRNAGFSLTESMVAISIIGLLIAAAVPNLRSYREAQRVAGGAQKMAAVCRAAQAQARSENHDVILEYRPNDNTLAVIDDENNNGSADNGETVIEHPIGDGLQLASTSFTNDQLVFDSHGRATSGGTVLLRGRAGVQPKQLTIASGTGHVSIRGHEGS
jgi:prepilin-type N-terminal cleavage/methylation domain-containing protein